MPVVTYKNKFTIRFKTLRFVEITDKCQKCVKEKNMQLYKDPCSNSNYISNEFKKINWESCSFHK